MNAKATSLALLVVCVTAALTVWFSASAVLPSLTAEFAISPARASLFTSAVQAGFVAGTLVSAILGLADRLDSRRFFMGAALVAAGANALLLAVPPTSPMVIALRFITGACMAGIYPVGMKMAATWARGDLGLLIAVLVAAVILGSASPHLFNAWGGIDWRFTIAASSAAAAVAAGLVNLVRLGPGLADSPPFDPRYLLRAFRSAPLRLANFGYLGHMWELYAMWAWLGVFLDASFRTAGGAWDAAFWARMTMFAAMGVGGAAGSIAGGLLADRYGRTALAIGAMTLSGACALVMGWLFGAEPWLLAVVAMVWGIAVVADSAQFSASVAELCEPALIGTMLTVQTSAGFLLTLLTIHLMPPMVAALGWGPAFAVLALGPFFGIWAMARLRAHPEAARLAGGRR